MTARAGDEAFEELIEPHRRSITLHCYRMLGSIQDAEELAQEALLRAWQRRSDVRSAAATRAWLYAIATNVCLDHLRKVRRRRALPHLVGPASAMVRLAPPTEERLWIEPAPDALLDLADDADQRPDARASRRESIGLAFITALQSLSPKQRAALLLVDVLGWTPQETAAVLETSVASVNSLLQRARKHAGAAEHDAARPPVSSADEALLRRFIGAWERGDLDALAALLADDARLSMPPQAEWYAGRAAVRGFFAAVWSRAPGERRLVPVAANGGLAVAVYRRGEPLGAGYAPSGIMLLELRADRVAELTRFAFPALFGLFGLPLELPAASGERPAASGER